MNTGLWESKSTYFGLIALVFLTAFFFLCNTLDNPDLAWLAFATERMLAGGVLYRDLMETNPPLVFWLYTAPVALASTLGLSLVFSIKLCTLLLAAVVIAASERILRHSPLWQGTVRYSFLVAIAGVLLIAADSYMVFSQREHVLVVFLLPYVLFKLPSVFRQEIGKGWQFSIGVLAALGLCLKPHFFAIFLMIHLCKWLQGHSLKNQIDMADIAIIAVTVAYSAAAWIFVPQYFTWLAVFSGLYGAHGFFKLNTSYTIIHFMTMALAGALCAWAVGLFRRSSSTEVSREITFLAMVAVGAYLEALLQFKVWEYISYPFLAFGAFLVAAAILLKPIKQFWMFLLTAWLFYQPGPIGDERQEQIVKSKQQALSDALEFYGDKPDMYSLALGYMHSSAYRASPPLAWSGKFNSFYYLLAGMMERLPSGQPSLRALPDKKDKERWLLDAIAEDITAKNPSLIFTSRQWESNESKDDAFDFIAWLEQDSRTAKVMNDYFLDKELTLSNPTAHQYFNYRFYIRKP